jgi:transcriptional regulator with XRE-family HTH domain
MFLHDTTLRVGGLRTFPRRLCMFPHGSHTATTCTTASFHSVPLDLDCKVLHDFAMPKLDKVTFRTLRAEADWSTAQLAELLGMAEGSLRNAESAREPMSLRRIHRAARLFSKVLRRQVTYRDLVADGNDGIPDEPPAQPKNEPTRPPGRDDQPGPRRAHGRSANTAA